MFGELSALLDQPHTADVRALETSQFHVASAEVLAEDPFVLLYVTAMAAVQFLFRQLLAQPRHRAIKMRQISRGGLSR